MKKIFALLTALVLALAVGCAFAEETDDSVPPSTPEMKAFEGTWISAETKTLLWIGRQDDGFQMQAVRQTGEDTFTSWEYIAGFDAETKSIKNADGTKCDCKVTDGVDNVIDGTSAEGLKAGFTIQDEKLTWKDETAGTETVFTKIGGFLGQYCYDRAMVSIGWDAREDRYLITVTWAQSAWEVWEYQLEGTYDPKTETVAFQGTKHLDTYKDDGELDTTADTQEEKVEGTFSLNENSELVWKSSDGAGDGIVFENTWIPLWACSVAFGN